MWLLRLSVGEPAPPPVPEWNPDPMPYIMVMIAGFVIGVAGHLFRSKMMVLAGVLGVFAGTILLPLVTYLSRS